MLEKNIHVEPKAISRGQERSGLTKGSRQIQAGRLSAIEMKAKAKAKRIKRSIGSFQPTNQMQNRTIKPINIF